MILVFYMIVDLFAILFFKIAEIKRNKVEKNNITHTRGKIYAYNFFLFLTFIILSLVLGLRHYSVGVDTDNYRKVFFRIIDGTMTVSDRRWISLGFLVLNKVVGIFFGKNYVVLNCIIGFFSIFFLLKSIWNNSDNPTLSLYIFIAMCLYYQMMNQARQMLALVIVMYSYQYLKERNFIRYAICIGIASLMHTSAIIMLPFYFIANFKINNKFLFLYLIVTIATILCFDYIILLISKTNYGLIYSQTGYFQAKDSSKLNLIIRLLMLFGVLIFKKKLLKEDSESKFLYNLVIWCTLFQIITLKVYILGRVTSYFFVFYIFLIPKIIHCFPSQRRIYISVLVVILFFIYHIVYFNYSSVTAGYDVYKLFML